VFTPAERERLRDELVAAARADERIAGAAHTGSAAVGREDRWSDIDLALGLAPGVDVYGVVADWTERMYRAHGAVAHHDVMRGSTLFRVFLLENTLQVDLAFWLPSEFGAIGPTFRLVFGTAAERPPVPPPAARDLIGMAWLYALHVRSSVARGRLWQGEYMVSGMRDHVLALACVRHGVPAHQGRGLDDLPPDVTRPLAESLVRSLDAAEIKRAFAATTDALLREIELVDADLARRLAGPLWALLD
jgi:hypothetical protein